MGSGISRSNKQILTVCDYKIIGCFGLVDQGEMDWKILALEVNEAKTLGVHDVKSYENRYPGALHLIREWFRTIKTFDGKAENTFLANGNVIGREETLEIIKDCNNQYKSLMEKKRDGFWLGDK